MVTIGALIGGLGLFLLAVGMITDGLRTAAGEALRDLLGRWTRTPLHGIGAGTLITGIVQSSSAVTVATIGFVNANLLTLHQALGVVYGANIGTTFTGWLVAAVGFKIKVEIFALPMIGIGMLLRITGAMSQRGAIGTALAGFGLFFIGIDALRGAFEGLAQGFDLNAIDSDSPVGLLLFVSIGIVMTVITQASAAAIAITLTAATGGLISIPAAAAVVIGANVGTTSTAIFAALGATPNAKRVATAHVIFNLATGAVALLLLPLLLWLVGRAGELLSLEAVPAVVLALFHTVFNILGVLLMWPLTGRLAAFLSRRFVTPAEDLGKPRYLDTTTVQTPLLAQDAMRLELIRVVDMARTMASSALARPVDRARIDVLQQAVHGLAETVDDVVARLQRARQSEDEARALPGLLKQNRRLRETADAAVTVAGADLDFAGARDYLQAAGQLLSEWRPESVLADEALVHRLKDLKRSYEQAREAVLDATAMGQFRPARANGLLDALRAAHRMVQQLGKVAIALHREPTPGIPLDAAPAAVNPIS